MDDKIKLRSLRGLQVNMNIEILSSRVTVVVVIKVLGKLVLLVRRSTFENV